jgi:CheY-like chemotaxis protein
METDPGGDRDERSAEVLFITDDPALAAVYRLRLEIDDYAVTWVEPAAVSGILGAVDPDLVYLDADSAASRAPSILAQLRRAVTTREKPRDPQPDAGGGAAARAAAPSQ